MTKKYIGDGVYADFDGYCLTLTVEDGKKVTNIILLEPEVYTALVKYVESNLGIIEEGKKIRSYR